MSKFSIRRLNCQNYDLIICAYFFGRRTPANSKKWLEEALEWPKRCLAGIKKGFAGICEGFPKFFFFQIYPNSLTPFCFPKNTGSNVPVMHNRNHRSLSQFIAVYRSFISQSIAVYRSLSQFHIAVYRSLSQSIAVYRSLSQFPNCDIAVSKLRYHPYRSVWNCDTLR